VHCLCIGTVACAHARLCWVYTPQTSQDRDKPSGQIAAMLPSSMTMILSGSLRLLVVIRPKIGRTTAFARISSSLCVCNVFSSDINSTELEARNPLTPFRSEGECTLTD